MPLPEDVTKDWPAELKSAPALQDVKDVAGLAKRFVDTQAMVGASIRIPSQDAGPEALKEFAGKLEKVPGVVYLPDEPTAREVALKDVRRKLGVPDDAKGYTLDGVDIGDVQIPEAELEGMRKRATDRRHTKEQFRDDVKELVAAKVAGRQAEREMRLALQRELGAAFEERTLAASLQAEKLGFPEAVVKALRNGAVDLPTYRAFAQVAQGFGQKPQVGGQGGGAGGGKLTPAELIARRDEIMANSWYFNPKPNELGLHRAGVAKVQELNELIDASR